MLYSSSGRQLQLTGPEHAGCRLSLLSLHNARIAQIVLPAPSTVARHGLPVNILCPTNLCTTHAPQHQPSPLSWSRHPYTDTCMQRMDTAVAMDMAASAIGRPVGTGVPGTALRGTGGMATQASTLPSATGRPGTAGSTAGIAAAVEVLRPRGGGGGGGVNGWLMACLSL